MTKVIYAGFPMLLCENEDCNTVKGFWSFILDFHFNGYFIGYEGNYFKGLYYFLFRGDEI